MIIAYCCLLILVLHAALPGSRLRELAGIRLKHTTLIWLALLDQILVISVFPGNNPGLSAAAHLASYGLAGLFFFFNRRLAGAWIVAVGGAANAAAIMANGGTMPASAAALRTSGWQPAPGKFANSAALPDPHLAFLGDVFATPPWFPVHSVFSLGDIIIVVGMAIFIQRTCRPRRKGGDPHPVDVGEGEPRAGVGAFLAQDQPRPGRPALQVDQSGGLGDPGPVPQPAADADRRGLARLGDQVHDPLDGVVDAEEEPHPTVPAGRGKRVGRPGGVRAGQHPR